MNLMMLMLAQQRIADMHRAAADDRRRREATSVRGDNVQSTRRWRRGAQTVCAT